MDNRENDAIISKRQDHVWQYLLVVWPDSAKPAINIEEEKKERIKNMSEIKSQKQTGLSEKAKQNLELNAQLRKQDSSFFNPQPGEKSVLIFDAEKVQPVKKIFDGKPFQKFQYTVQDPNTGYEKYWTVSKRTSEQIDAYLTEGQNVLKVHRIGTGTDTRYTIMPAY